MADIAMSPKSDHTHNDHSEDSADTKHFDHSHNVPASALTPPTSEDNNVKLETGSTSDLSDVPGEEPQLQDEEEEEEIVPDHYYDGGKIPVFKPVSLVPSIHGDVMLIIHRP